MNKIRNFFIHIFHRSINIVHLPRKYLFLQKLYIFLNYEINNFAEPKKILVSLYICILLSIGNLSLIIPKGTVNSVCIYI